MNVSEFLQDKILDLNLCLQNDYQLSEYEAIQLKTSS